MLRMDAGTTLPECLSPLSGLHLSCQPLGAKLPSGQAWHCAVLGWQERAGRACAASRSCGGHANWPCAPTRQLLLWSENAVGMLCCGLKIQQLLLWCERSWQDRNSLDQACLCHLWLMFLCSAGTPKVELLSEYKEGGRDRRREELGIPKGAGVCHTLYVHLRSLPACLPLLNRLIGACPQRLGNVFALSAGV